MLTNHQQGINAVLFYDLDFNKSRCLTDALRCNNIFSLCGSVTVFRVQIGPSLCLGPRFSYLQPCMSGRQSVVTRSSYSSSTSRSSRRLRRWWECFPFCGGLGGRWQLLPGEPASVSYARPPALSPRTAGRRQGEHSELRWGEEVSLEDYYRIKLEYHTHKHHCQINHTRLNI